MISLPAGSLNRRIMLVKPSQTQGNTAGVVLPPVVQATVWASIRPMSGSEVFRSQAFVDQADTTVTMRYRPNVTSDLQVMYGARRFYIKAVLNENEANVVLTLLCLEIL